MRLDRFLAEANFGSRKHVKKMIKDRRIRVFDDIITDPGFSLDPDSAEVYFDDVIIPYQKTLYYLLNKPKDYMCSTIDELYPSVLNLLPEIYQKRLRIVGRLDADTTGVLFLTDDGKLNNYLANPKNHIEKTYRVTLNHDLSPALVDRLRSPVDIGRGEISSPCKLEIVNPNVGLLTLMEGKYHEVKRIFHHFDLEVIDLDRIKFHQFEYGNLKLGEYRRIEEKEIEGLLDRVHPERKF